MRRASAGASSQSVTRRLVTGFVLRTLLGWTVGLTLLAILPQVGRWAIQATLSNLLLVLHALSLSGHVSGDVLVAPGATIQIVDECTSVLPTVLLGVAMASYPAAAAWKLIGLVVGTVALWVYNLLRVLGLLVVLAWRPELFEIVHVYVWQTMTFLAVAGLFVLWLRLERSAGRAG